jgi:hypothetical protein
MTEPSDQFKKSPRRKAPRGKSVSVSAEAKQAYLDLIRERDRLALSYGQHLPQGESKR